MRNFFTYLLTITAIFLNGFTLLPTAAAQSTANLQIIHNSADPVTASVDVYIDGELTLSAVEFRSATEFLEIPGDTPLDITISPAGIGIEAGYEFSDVVFEADENYYAIANGVLAPAAYAENPDGIETTFYIDLIKGAQTTSSEENFDFLFYHGSTDAPAVEVFARNISQLVDSTAYSNYSDDYISVPADNYVLDVSAAGNDATLFSYEANLSTLGGQTGIILASGFLDPSNNNDEAGFGVLVALNNGTTFLLPEITPETAKVQIIHNSPDPAVSTVDIYVNGELELPGIEFRSATGFIELPADTDLDITVTPSGATPGEGKTTEKVQFSANESYYVVASGVLNPSMFASNPDGVDTEFFLDVIPGASLTAAEGDFDFLLYHGSPDAGAVDITARDVTTLATNIAYTGYSSDYLSVPASNYIIDLFNTGDEAPFISLDADVSAFGGQTAIIFASGFVNPDDNESGPEFGVFVALQDGRVIELGIATSSERMANAFPEQFKLDQNYPNPFNPNTTISYSLPRSSQVTIAVFDITGKQVAVLVNTEQSAGSYAVNFDASSLSSGVYMYRIQTNSFVQTRKMTLLK